MITKLKPVLAILLLCICSVTRAQSYKQLSMRIDSFAAAFLPKSALAEVDKFDAKAHSEHNAPMQVKAVIYRMTFESAIEENTIVPIINRLKQDIAASEYPVKPVLQSLLGTMYLNYYQQNRWQFMQRTKLAKRDTDFTKWDLQTINNEISKSFNLSLQAYRQEQNTPISILDGVLTGDKKMRYLRPTLYDLLLDRALVFFLSEESGLTRPKNAFALTDPRLFADSRTFSQLNVTSTDTASVFYQGVKYLQQGTTFHLNDGESMIDLDLRRLEFLYRQANVLDKDSLYLKALRQIADTYPTKAIIADDWILQGTYYENIADNKTAYAWYKKAKDTFPKSIGGLNAAIKMKQLEHKELAVAVENVNTPNEPILAQMTYRNIKTAHIAVFKLSIAQYDHLVKVPSDINRYTDGSTIYASDSVFNYLKKLKPVQDEDLSPPDPGDYKNHTTEFKINALKSGHYVLAIRDARSDDKSLMLLTGFKVSKLAYTTRFVNDKGIEVLVMDRAKGTPVSGVHVTLAENYPGITDASGKCYIQGISSPSYSIKLTSSTDTLYSLSNYTYMNLLYVAPRTTTVLFTDRAIYRPGQTIYFKGLCLLTGGGNKNSLMPEESKTVKISDSNGKQLTSISVKINDFGTFSGTYVLPQSILNGEISISTGDGSKYVNVEEYKRPTFEVSFLPVMGSYKPNDSVTVQGKVTAYSGFGLSQARVAYHVKRSTSLVDRIDYRQYGRYVSNNAEFVTDTIKTDAQGGFEIKFKASATEGTDIAKFSYYFSIDADVTDGNGETRSASAGVDVAQNNINITATLPATLSARDSIRLVSSIKNLNNGLISGNIQVKVYALQSPERNFKSRLWPLPDQYMLSKEQYRKDFPTHAYGNETNRATWPVIKQIGEYSLVANNKPVIFKLDELQQQPTGTYKVVAMAKDENGDTASVTKYVYVVNKPAIANNWVVPLNTTARPGKPAQILIGYGRHNRVQMETYENGKLLSEQWFEIAGNKQRLIEVPVKPGQRSITLQFLMVSENREYTRQVIIFNTAESDNLDVKLMTFRNVLQPGEKEEWKLRITNKNNEKQAAEMVADMYDASLDDLNRQDDWPRNINNYQYWVNNWGNNLVQQAITNPLKYNYTAYGTIPRDREHLDMFGYNYYGGYNYFYRSFLTKGKVELGNVITYKTDTTEYKASDYSVMSNSSVDELLKKMEGMQVGADGSITAQGKAVSQVRINGKDFMGNDVARATQNLPADILESVQLIDDYGDQGRLMGRTGDPRKVLNINIRPIATRKNFAETAFFYPQLQTDEIGEILIDFTIPETLTKWRFKAFAHTKDLKSGYIEQDIVTQKQLSISANTPRFLREGDTITISARLANLVTIPLKGKVNLQLFNGINMQPVNLLANPNDAQQSFDIASASTKAVSFKIIVPPGLDALTYKLTADAGQFTDGEENTIPVLPNRMLVTESNSPSLDICY